MLQYRYFIKLSYKGTSFHGWQKQRNAHTVQAEIENALKVLANVSSNGITGCGRTDTGVSAFDYYCHFDTPEKYTAPQIQHLVHRLNKILPPSISIKDIQPVIPEAHARFSADSRTYLYQVLRIKDPFLLDSCYYFTQPLDLEVMNQGCNILQTFNDFTSFSKTGTQVRTNNCRVSHAEWIQNEKLYLFRITADRFLRNMVRAIVGTLIDLGRGKITLDQLITIIQSKDRGRAGNSVPANGLYLEQVLYPDDLFVKEPLPFNSYAREAADFDHPDIDTLPGTELFE